EEALSALADRHTNAAVQGLAALAASHPNAPVFQTTYARALQESGQPARALGVYRAAVRRWPNDAALLHDLAVTARDAAARTAGDAAHTLLDEAARADAVPWLERAVAATPDFTEARLNLGIALQQSGARARAIEVYRGVLAARGAAREKEAAAKLLASLGAAR